MARIDISTNFRATLAELADMEPRHGFQIPTDVRLDAGQAATVIEHEPDIMLDALVDVLPVIAAQIREGTPDGISAVVLAALMAAAQRVTLRELVSFCDERRLEVADDRAYETGGVRKAA